MLFRSQSACEVLPDVMPLVINVIRAAKSKMTHTTAARAREPCKAEELRFEASKKLIVLLATTKLLSGAIAG